MRKITALLFITLLLGFIVTHAAARPKSFFRRGGSLNPDFLGEDSCYGIDEDECLKRRALAANLDYIYTQDDNN
ncbi:Phytosulfokine [Vigna unguiculata]|uniref:Phytosulfokine n=1 Tax=Vigna unguiculata TaxID=3917 RepID=A0A4D6LSU3_VIGUN|nr:Phytosulfokine [Vigna unguiculata]